MRSLALTIGVLSLAACGGGDDGPQAMVLTVGALGEPKVDGSKVTLDFNLKKSGTNDPVAGLTYPANFTVLEDGKKISEADSTPSLTSNPKAFRSMTLLLVDVSKSNATTDSNLDKTRAAAKEFANDVIGTSGSNKYLAVYVFASDANITKLIDFSNDLGIVNTMLDSQLTCATTNVPKLCVDIGRNLNGGIVKGLDTLKTARAAIEGTGTLTAGALAVFTGGPDTAAVASESSTLNAILDGNNTSSVFVVALGATDATVMRYGKDGYFTASDLTGLSEAFQKLADRVNAFANSFYRLQYCTPKRSGTHTVEVQVTYTDEAKVLYKGSVQKSFKATTSITCTIQ